MQKAFILKNLSQAVLLFLLAWRFILAIIIFRFGKLTYWENAIFLCISYALIATLLLLDKSVLYNLNVDKKFVIIFSVLGYAYSFAVPWFLGVFFAFASTLSFSVFFSNQANYAKNKGNYRTLVILSLLAWLILVFVYLILRKDMQELSIRFFYNTAFFYALPLLLIEEFIFRGLLWKFLQGFNLSKNKIIFIQALLFWLCHFYYYADAAFFWFSLPLWSLLLGYLTSKTKSITFSLYLHFLDSFVSFMFRF